MTEDLTRINANRLQKVQDVETVALAWTILGEILAKDHNGVVTKINNDEDIHQVNTRLGRSNQGTWMRGRGGDNIASARSKAHHPRRGGNVGRARMRFRKTWRGAQPDPCVDGALKTYTRPSQPMNGDTHESNTVSSEAGSVSGDVTTP
ncbi:hypothetical protein ElyMa_001761600 [Elysia marginata]|uniref:Uncharacterized protein n=1 Tax=Elysia marginata TaxID=1093978 RepID=A0AAV4EB52_9GAST|nr:hypothetical protein ElyMa_001761600 [Elysia marginata]